jgi:hypothetical protein
MLHAAAGAAGRDYPMQLSPEAIPPLAETSSTALPFGHLAARPRRQDIYEETE